MHYDLVVIGAGPAGEKGAAQAAYFGKRVCIIERSPKPGGAAVNTGAVPSKSLRETALYFSRLRQRGLYGVDVNVKRDIGLGDFMLRERAVIEAQWKLIEENLARHGIDQIQGSATFVDANTIEVTRYGVEPRRLTADYFVIATGARPKQPDGIDVDGQIVVDSTSLLTLEQIPASMLVIGGGMVACEYACIFAALGVRVTVITSRARLLSHVDGDVSDALRQQMTARLGITVYVDAPIAKLAVESGRAVVTLGQDTELSADCALYAEARVGAADGLGLERAGVTTNAQGFIVVDDHFRSAQPHIYAAGDAIGFPALAATAMEQARVAVCHAFDLRYKQQLASVLPYVVHTIPEIATVGRGEEALRAADVPYEIGRAWYRTNARGLITGDTEGFVKLLFHPDSQRLLGASIVGENAGELIHIAMGCIANDGTIDFFIQSVFTYPSLAEAYKYAAYDGLQALARRHARRAGLPSSGSHRAVVS